MNGEPYSLKTVLHCEQFYNSDNPIEQNIQENSEMNVCNLWEFVKYQVKRKCIELSKTQHQKLLDNFRYLGKKIETTPKGIGQ